MKTYTCDSWIYMVKCRRLGVAKLRNDRVTLVDIGYSD